MPLSLGGENVFGEGCCCFGAGILFSGPGTRKNALSDLAEREGFEPPIPVKVCPLSRRIVSTTHAPLRAKLTMHAKPIPLLRDSAKPYLDRAIYSAYTKL